MLYVPESNEFHVSPLIWRRVDEHISNQLPLENYDQIYSLDSFSLSSILAKKIKDSKETEVVPATDMILRFYLSDAATMSSFQNDRGCCPHIKYIILESLKAAGFELVNVKRMRSLISELFQLRVQTILLENVNIDEDFTHPPTR